MTNIDALKDYPYIQDLDISNNNISDLSVLSNLKGLVRLNASRNNISELLAFENCSNFTEADFSYNKISILDESILRKHLYLRKLNLEGKQL